MAVFALFIGAADFSYELFGVIGGMTAPPEYAFLAPINILLMVVDFWTFLMMMIPEPSNFILVVLFLFRLVHHIFDIIWFVVPLTAN